MRQRSARVTPEHLTVREARSIATRHLGAGESVYRCHRRRRTDGQAQGSWYFSSGIGRFDLPGPDGTLNVAREAIGAVTESFGHLLIGAATVRREEIDARKLVRLALVHDVEVADLFDATAARAGIVTGELTAPGPDYAAFQSLASSFRAAGIDGLARAAALQPERTRRRLLPVRNLRPTGLATRNRRTDRPSSGRSRLHHRRPADIQSHHPRRRLKTGHLPCGAHGRACADSTLTRR